MKWFHVSWKKQVFLASILTTDQLLGLSVLSRKNSNKLPDSVFNSSYLISPMGWNL